MIPTEVEPGKEKQQPQEKVAILDAGAQYGKVIDRRVRELSVESVMLPLDTPADALLSYRAIIISGGPESVYEPNAPKYDPEIFNLGKPILGICYGMQLMNHVAGGRVERGQRREDGPCTIAIQTDSLLFKTLTINQEVLMSHGDSATQIAPGFRAIANSNGLVAAIENPDRKMWGVQFHPEVDLTFEGKTILKNFLYEIAGLSGTYTIEDRERNAIDFIKETVGNKQVLVLVSGGVDSTVCVALLTKALGAERVHAVHIDNGFMRLDESIKVAAALEALGLKLRVVDASQLFYSATTQIDGMATPPLNKVVNPETKRKIIGDTFMRAAENAIQDLKLNPNDMMLAQGTLRPDLIESASVLASSKAQVIKSHHNDTALVRELRSQGKIIEPLKDYHKDEVRILGKNLGLPDEIVWRQPFPGPGLAIRIICSEKPYITDDFDEINSKLRTMTPDRIFATLLPIRTVGVQGDGRSYSHLVGISGRTDWTKLFELAREIPRQIRGVNRVVYIFGASIEGPVREITPTYLTKDVIEQLQLADDIVNQVLLKRNLIRTLSQVPVVSFPVHFGKPGQRAIGIRTFITNDFMTGVPAIPGKDIAPDALNEMVTKIVLGVPNVSRVVYDLTSKPPGTTEWE